MPYSQYHLVPGWTIPRWFKRCFLDLSESALLLCFATKSCTVFKLVVYTSLHMYSKFPHHCILDTKVQNHSLFMWDPLLTMHKVLYIPEGPTQYLYVICWFLHFHVQNAKVRKLAVTNSLAATCGFASIELCTPL